MGLGEPPKLTRPPITQSIVEKLNRVAHIFFHRVNQCLGVNYRLAVAHKRWQNQSQGIFTTFLCI